jgi:hypothetical protein
MKELNMSHRTTISLSHLLASGLVALAGLSATAGHAQGVTLGEHQAARVDHRQERQDARIDQGVASGELTRHEQAHMQAQQARIGRMEHRAEADGQVTGKEAVRLEHAQDHASRSIARQKHDRQHRPAHKHIAASR